MTYKNKEVKTTISKALAELISFDKKQTEVVNKLPEVFKVKGMY